MQYRKDVLRFFGRSPGDRTLTDNWNSWHDFDVVDAFVAPKRKSCNFPASHGRGCGGSLEWSQILRRRRRFQNECRSMSKEPSACAKSNVLRTIPVMECVRTIESVKTRTVPKHKPAGLCIQKRRFAKTFRGWHRRVNACYRSPANTFLNPSKSILQKNQNGVNELPAQSWERCVRTVAISRDEEKLTADIAFLPGANKCFQNALLQLAYLFHPSIFVTLRAMLKATCYNNAPTGTGSQTSLSNLYASRYALQFLGAYVSVYGIDSQKEFLRGKVSSVHHFGASSGYNLGAICWDFKTKHAFSLRTIGCVKKPVSYTHMTLPTNREV